MSLIVGVHGIGQQFKGEETLRSEWLPALRDGLHRVRATLSDDDDLRCAFYGDVFRKRIKSLQQPLEAEDVEDWEAELLFALWDGAADNEPAVPGRAQRTKARTPGLVQRGLNGLARSAFFAGIAERAMIADLKQVRGYMHDATIRDQIQARVRAAVTDDTRVLVGHSLGSVVAYEAVFANPGWKIDTLVTLGSPLGIRNLIFDRLRPPPEGGAGQRPNVARWVNVADRGDVVALVKALSSAFGGAVDDRPVDNGATAHNIRPYLTAAETGDAIAVALP